MAPIATVTRAAYLGLESAHGTPVAASKIYHGLELALANAGDFASESAQGYKVDTNVYPITEFTAGEFRGRGDFQALTVGLASAIVNPAATRNIPSTGLSYTRVFALDPRNPDAYASFTADVGDSTLARRAAFVFANGITIDFGRRGFSWTAPAIGRGFTSGVTLEASPTEIPAIPMVPRLSDVYLDPSFATIGSTKLLSNFSGRFALGNRRATKWPMNSSLSSYSDAYELKPTIETTLTMEADATSDTNLTAMRAGDTVFARAVYTGPTIETIYTYKFQMDFALKVVQAPNFDDLDGLQTTPWVFRNVSVPTNMPGGFIFTLVNTIAAL